MDDNPGSSEHSVKPSPMVEDGTKQLKAMDLSLESNRQQAQLALQQYLHTQPALPTPADRPMIQSEDNQKQIAKVDNGQNEAKLNPPVQALFAGTLPDDFYLHLMSVTGIQECLMSNRLVCKLWNNLVLERCKSQKSLKLFETFDCLMEYGDDLLHFDKTEDASLILKSIGDVLLFEGLEIDHEQLFNSLNEDNQKGGSTLEKKRSASQVLTTFCPSVEELVVCPEYVTLINIEHLLQFYAEQLTSLTIHEFGIQFNEDSSRKLQGFNFPKLKSLHTFHFSPPAVQLLSLLPQLESLTLEGTALSLETLLRTGTQLCELYIESIDWVFTAPAVELSKRPPINTNLRKFSFEVAQNEWQALEFIKLNLTSLECLKLGLYCVEENVRQLSSVTSYLVPLRRLHSFTLQTRVSIFLLNDSQLAAVKPLPSVRHLKLFFWDYSSLSMDLFSRALFAAFPNVVQVSIAFSSHHPVDNDTLAAFEDFAGKHPNVVQLFRSRDTSKFTSLPNAVSPLLGQYRQVYEEYLEEQELFGVPICKLSPSLVNRQGEECPNLKNALRPGDQLSAMSNWLHLLESRAFTFTFKMVDRILRNMVECARNCGSSQMALFIVTCKCILSLIESSVLMKYAEEEEHYLYYAFQLELVEHYQRQQFKEEDLLLQLHHSMDKLIEEMLDTPQFETVIKANLLYSNRVYQVETALALLRVSDKASDY